MLIRVLVIDASAADAGRLRGLLGSMRSLQAEVVLAARGALAEERLREGGVDVALVDLGSGNARDASAVTRVCNAAPELAIIALGSADDGDRTCAALAAGAQDVLVVATITSDELERSISFAIARSRAASERVLARERLLGEVSESLGASTAHDENLVAMVRLLVPHLGDACAIDVVAEDGTLRRVAAARIHGASASVPRPAPVESAPCWRAILPGGTCLVAPLSIRGRVHAVLTAERIDAARTYGATDLALACELASRAALATEASILRRSRDEMLAIVSHDLRNPLGVVTLSAATMRRNTGTTESKLNPVEKIRRAAEQMSVLIGDMIDMSRIETGDLPIDAAPEPTLPLLGRVFEAMRPLADEKQLKLVTEVTGVLPPIHVDRERVLQVLSNLIADAIQFSPAGGTVKIGAQLDGDSVCLWVSDSGPTMPPEDQARLFEPAWRAKRPGQRGSGLTLLVTRGIVRAHGGQIWLTTSAGVGSTFHVTFPIAASATGKWRAVDGEVA